MAFPPPGEGGGGDTYIMFVPGGYVIDITVPGLRYVLECIRMGHLL